MTRERLWSPHEPQHVLIETNGGFDYTGADCEGWMREAEFAQTRVEHLIGPNSTVIGIKYDAPRKLPGTTTEVSRTHGRHSQPSRAAGLLRCEVARRDAPAEGRPVPARRLIRLERGASDSSAGRPGLSDAAVGILTSEGRRVEADAAAIQLRRSDAVRRPPILRPRCRFPASRHNGPTPLAAGPNWLCTAPSAGRGRRRAAAVKLKLPVITVPPSMIITLLWAMATLVSTQTGFRHSSDRSLRNNGNRIWIAEPRSCRR